jgi:hypothetical protein
LHEEEEEGVRKMDCKKIGFEDVGMWIGFIWLRMRSCGGLVRT